MAELTRSDAWHRQGTPDQLVGILKDTIVALVRRDGPDLTARQLSVFLTVYLGEGPHTVRGLAACLNVSKPAITRALDRLEEFNQARRRVDPKDRRSVLVRHTVQGAALLREIQTIMTEAAVSEAESLQDVASLLPPGSTLARSNKTFGCAKHNPRNPTSNCKRSRKLISRQAEGSLL